MEDVKVELQATLDFASFKHRNKFRKGKCLPYISHPLEVLKMVQQWGITSLDMWKACLCHDVIEDTHTTYAELIEAIGKEASMFVGALTFKLDPKNPAPPNIQKSAYMASFSSAIIQALIIKVADRCCNTLDFLDTDPNYAEKYWHKADKLFEAFAVRESTIRQLFGDSVFENMRNSKHRVEQLLATAT